MTLSNVSPAYIRTEHALWQAVHVRTSATISLRLFARAAGGARGSLKGAGTRPGWLTKPACAPCAGVVAVGGRAVAAWTAIREEGVRVMVT